MADRGASGLRWNGKAPTCRDTETVPEDGTARKDDYATPRWFYRKYRFPAEYEHLLVSECERRMPSNAGSRHERDFSLRDKTTSA
jgi:hypothetical protein